MASTMTFTTEQLEALKEGAPVMHRSSKGAGATRIHSVKADNGMLRALVGYGPDGGTAYKDAELFAAAPELVDALIAEKRAHAELRKRIEERIRELKQPLCSHMPEGDELDDYLEQWGRQSYEAAVLTEILAGNG